MALLLYINNDVLEELKKIRYKDPRPAVRKKAEALILHSQGLRTGEISKIMGVWPVTIRGYFHQFKVFGLEGLLKERKRPKIKGLYAFRDQLIEEFRKSPPTKVSEARERIFHLTGLRRGNTQVRVFLKFLGMKFRKTGIIPAKVDLDKQEDFKKKIEPLLEKAKNGKRKVYFADAAHFVYGAYQGFLWCFQRIFVKSGHGRRRYNSAGAYDPINHHLVSTEGEENVDHKTICQLLRKLRYRSGKLPVTIILDNAAYNRSHKVKSLALKLKIDIEYLPPYSPNLNLIERYWKFLKSHCLNSKFYKNFEAFKSAVESVIQNTNISNQIQAKLKTLITLNFQTFKKEILESD